MRYIVKKCIPNVRGKSRKKYRNVGFYFSIVGIARFF